MLAQPPDVGFRTCQTGAVNAALLAGADADGLTVFHIANGVRLRVFEGNEGDGEIAHGRGGQLLVLRGALVEEVRIRKIHLVASLFEGDAEHLFAFDGIGYVVGIHLQNAIRAFALGLQDLERFGGEPRGYNAVAHFAFDEQGGCLVAFVGKGDEITVTRHTIGAASAGISRGDGSEGFAEIVAKINLLQRFIQRFAHCCAGRRYMFERGRCRQAGGGFELAH